ncbi:hypothetical protein [Nocardia iowensis]|uniref:Uncharacterized protein n=1 Tax=Nocardia iowensis TaxID=204891 RepID=A0ABX8S129_NOCIO|nr:hypothetical protein [Nocardia iowensis]QXN94774.1 hypothetical protein KV110_18020 [Nocardia iowensis]
MTSPTGGVHADNTGGPHATPVFDLSSITSKTACWQLCTPEEKMAQPCVELVAWFCRQDDCYRADLVPFIGSSSRYGTRWTPPKRVSIATVPGPKGCEHSVLEQLFHEAMTELVRRFDAGDPEVTALFDPHSDVFDQHYQQPSGRNE